jgi:hypothetical protein
MCPSSNQGFVRNFNGLFQTTHGFIGHQQALICQVNYKV